jgi:hypothetical protein
MTSPSKDRPRLRLVPAEALAVALPLVQLLALRDAALNDIADITEHEHIWTGQMLARQQRVRSALRDAVDTIEATIRLARQP